MRIPDGVHAVCFDAVGTLIHPEPSAGAVYAEVGRRYGSRLAADEIRRRFGQAFVAQERYDAAHGYRVDEAREVERWRHIVAAVLDDVADGEGCFQALYAHFAQPAAWRLEDGAAEVVHRLSDAGYVVGVASNFDHRLRDVLAGLPLPPLGHLLISSEVGWKKPAAAFFARMTAVLSLAPQEILFVGDDAENDYAGATAAGLQAVLLAPGGPRLRDL